MADPILVKPLITEAIFIKIIVASTVSMIAGFFSKILWDYFTGGRVEKAPVYMTITSCQSTRGNCSVNNLKDSIIKTHEKLETYKAQTDARLKGIDKRMDESTNDIRDMMKDISEIKETSAASNAILETIQRGIMNNIK